MQKKIACTFMRSGTSRGPYLDLTTLPKDIKDRDALLLRIMGSKDPKQIDGLGGGTFVTSKVVMVGPSDRAGIDVNYLFAQVIADKGIVDTTPTCGNMMAGVGPFAIEKGWVKVNNSETKVMVYNFNTKATIEIIVQTPNGEVNYTHGDTKVDGVLGTGAPIIMNYFDLVGGATGKLFPTGNSKDIIHGLEVSIVDASNLLLLIKAEGLGLNGLENQTYFENNKQLMRQIENIRLEAGLRAGLGDVSKSVIPKVAILSIPQECGSIKSQYFTPHTLHPAHAVSGAVCIATACKSEGTIAHELAKTNQKNIEKMIIEHPSGILPVQIEVNGKGDSFTVVKAGTLRTARKIMDGYAYY